MGKESEATACRWHRSGGERDTAMDLLMKSSGAVLPTLKGGKSVKRALLAVRSAGQEKTPGRQEVSLVPLKLDHPPRRRQNLSLKTSSESCNCPKYSVCLDCVCQIYSPGNDLGALKID